MRQLEDRSCRVLGGIIILIEYTINKEDLLDFNLYHIFNSKHYKRYALFSRVIGPVILILAPIILFFITSSLLYSLSVYGVVAPLWIIYYPRYLRWHTKKELKKILGEGENRGVIGDMTIALTLTGIHQTSESGEEITYWSGVEKVIITDDHIFIYISTSKAYIIPKRELSVDTIIKFLEVLELF